MKRHSTEKSSLRITAILLLALAAASSALANNSAAPAPSQASIKTEIKPAPKAKSASATARWKLGLSGMQWQNTNELAQSIGMGVDADVNYKFNDLLLMKLWTKLSLRSGYTQTRFGEIGARNSVSLLEGYMQLTPGDVLTLQAGIINQGIWGLDNVIDGNPFPGAVQKIKIGNEYSLELKAGQSIPTVNTTDTRQTGAEPTPLFMAESLSINLEPKDALIHASAWGGHWGFQNLPASIAADSEAWGNSLTTVGGKRRFVYEFDGWFAGARGRVNFSKDTSAEAHIQVMENTRAPEGFNRGQMAGGSLSLLLPGNVTLEPGVDVFFSESDLAPAAFNSTELGHNNRQGVAIGIASSLKDLGLNLAATYVDSDLINPNPLQTRQQFIFFKFETQYANF